ncbi:hypothetical protein HPB50_027721 [Hyalomma asiaticum]|nr:hypothetical protein HPB50_027721 [Hyalomma asiaticum]
MRKRCDGEEKIEGFEKGRLMPSEHVRILIIRWVICWNSHVPTIRLSCQAKQELHRSLPDGAGLSRDRYIKGAFSYHRPFLAAATVFCVAKMPACAEHSKRIDELESRLLSESDRMNDRIVDKIVVKMKTSGVDVLELKKHMGSLEPSFKFLNDLVDKLHSEKASLEAENKALKNENYSLSRKVSELEQYSRMNNVEIRGIPCTQGEDCLAEHYPQLGVLASQLSKR